MAPKAWPVLVLHQSGDLSQASIKTTGGGLTLPAIQKFLKQKRGVECLATYKAKPYYLSLFGLADGPDEAQNQHQLPPPHEGTPIYGDIVLVASKDPKTFEDAQPFKPEQYEDFYTKMYDGGFDSDDDEAAAAGAEEEELTAAAAVGDEKEFGEEEAEVEEDAEAEEEEDAEAEEEDDAEAEAEVEADEEAPAPGRKPKAAAAKRKKAAPKSSAATLTGTGSAYPTPPILAEAEQLQEELPTAPFPDAGELAAARQQNICALGAVFAGHLRDDEIAALERAIYNGAIQQARQRHIVRTWAFPLFTHIYRMRARSVASNFHPESYVGNGELFDSYRRGELSMEAMAGMNTYELFPSLWRDMFEQRQIREKKALEGNKDRATDQFTCTRCWKKQCTYYEMQTRSADEPMTIFITCMNCGKKWRQ